MDFGVSATLLSHGDEGRRGVGIQDSLSGGIKMIKNCQMYGSRASLGPPRPRRSVASGSHQVAEVAIRHW